MARYGGNTSCVSVAVPGHDPLLFDLGTGLRYFGMCCTPGVAFRGVSLLSHLHWDHIQGLPFFAPLLVPGAHLDVFAPRQEDGRTLAQVFDATLAPPLFPVRLDQLPGVVRLVEVADDEFTIGEIEVVSRLVPHIGNTCGYRVTWGGASVAYVSDHQQGSVDRFVMPPGVRDLCQGVDVLIHDAQYTTDEFMRRADWGHCTADFAAWVANECDVGQLVLFHHDPLHDDDLIDKLVADVRALGGAADVVAAAEGLTLRVGGGR